MKTSSTPSSSPDHRGFTLIELLVVIAIIGILSALLLPALSMNYHMNGRSPEWAVPFQEEQHTGFEVYRKISGSPQPTRLFVLIDEREESINDGTFEMDPADLIHGTTTIVDYPADYHLQGGGLNFADGHSETRRWKDERTVPPRQKNKNLQLMVSSPGNPDIEWLKQRTSVRK